MMRVVSESKPSHPVFARFYEKLLASAEEAGLAEMRRELLARARGRTLEVGAGTGLNLAHYGPEVTELVLAEPDPHMAKRLRERIASEGSPVADTRVVDAGAEDPVFEDDSFDTAVTTLVLCTIPEPGVALAETKRVLKPDGRLLFIEHVHADGGALGWFQDRLERPWAAIAGGCHPNRHTADALPAAGFELSEIERTEMPKGGLVKPLIVGVAGPA